MRRALLGLLGVVLLVGALLLQSGASIVIAILGGVIVLSVIPYGSTSLRTQRYRR